VTGEEERLERVLPLIRKYGAAVVAISNDDTGISEDPDVRFEVARRIVERAADHGIPREDVIVDPLVMPIGAMQTAGSRCSGSCAACARSSASTRPAAPRT
jgi:5-methyltetrahydrofolate--homocysteine methyltransferase